MKFCSFPLLFLAACCVATLAYGQGPEQIHIAMTEASNKVYFTWVNQIDISTAVNSYCAAGEASGEYTMSGNATYHTYADGNFTGTVYEAYVEGFQPDTVYFYSCGSKELGFTKEYSFRMTPVVGVNRTVHILSFGDMGVKNSDDSVPLLSRDAETGLYDLIVANGDLGYQDDFGSVNNSYIVDNFFNRIEPFAARAFFMLVDGNHDTQFHYAAILNRTRMPEPWFAPSPAKLTRFYYSFDFGPVHFVFYSTDGGHSTEPGSEQYQFLQADLQRANQNRAQVPWIVAVTHHPMYCSDLLMIARCTQQAEVFRANLEELFHQNSLDVHFSGHNHNAEISYPVYNGTVFKDFNNAKAPVYIVNGSAGNVEGIDPTWWPKEFAPFRSFHSEFFHKGYGRMHVNHTHFVFEYIDASKDILEHTMILSKD